MTDLKRRTVLKNWKTLALGVQFMLSLCSLKEITNILLTLGRRNKTKKEISGLSVTFGE